MIYSFYAYSGRNDCLLDFNVTLNAYYENARRLYYKIAVPYEVTLYHEPYEKVYVDIELRCRRNKSN